MVQSAVIFMRVNIHDINIKMQDADTDPKKRANKGVWRNRLKRSTYFTLGEKIQTGEPEGEGQVITKDRKK